MTFDGAEFHLSTGRSFKAGFGAAIGLDDDSLTVGHDSHVRINTDPSEPTTEEKIEIADYVIAQWTAYKDSLAAGDAEVPHD